MVDVFAGRPYTGNPLAVVISEQGLSDGHMQRIAAEINYSETTFVCAAPATGGAYPVRMFTPAREVAFAGHPILGMAWVVRQYLAGDDEAQVRLSLAVGEVPVRFEATEDGDEAVWFRAPPMMLGTVRGREEVAAAVGVSAGDIEPDLPCQVVGAGTAALVVPLRALDALKRCRLDLAAFAPLAAAGIPPLVYLFCRETHHAGNDFCARFFFEAHGVREDPAAGNGAAFLGAYLLTHGVIAQSGASVRIEQGYEIRRPSLVRMRARAVGGLHEVEVGGRVIPTLRGELL